MTQGSLFDPERTMPTACTVPGCGAIRLPGQDTVVTCRCDLDRAVDGWTGNRPRLCLNVWDPSAAQFPEGY
jgi:hypothetical protein